VVKATWHDACVPRPLVAYLRVYEPLSSFDPSLRSRIERTLRSGALTSSGAADRERERWLTALLATPPRLLPGERPDGSPDPNAPLDVLVLDAAAVPAGPDSPVGPGSLVCPLDVRPRSAAALVGFLATSSLPLRQAVFALPDEIVRARAAAVVGEHSGGAVHVVSSTWTVPLPWFAMVEPDARHVVLAPRDDPARQVCWRVTLADARRRLAKALEVVQASLGDDGPAMVLQETDSWLEHFHPQSAVELDYGGLVQLLEDSELLDDRSAHDVHGALSALELGDADEVAEHFTRLRDFWSGLAAREHTN
jgi:hypothetical protein